jgi:hypothetical protein
MRVLAAHGLSHEEALEEMAHDVAGGWYGDGTPIVVHRVTRERAES